MIVKHAISRNRYKDDTDDEILDEDPMFSKDEVFCPEFAQIFELGNGLILGIERVERCPDETAIVRIVGEDWVSKEYRRRVYSSKSGVNRFIKVDGISYYLKEKVQVN